MAFRPYLAFAGNAREAFTRYQEIFGGTLEVMTMRDAPPDVTPPPGTNLDAVMHASLTTDDGLLMGADDMSGSFDGKNRGICLNCTLPDASTAKRVFDGLADGGEVQMPIGETFFSPAFGMCIDRFGTPWMVMVEQAP